MNGQKPRRQFVDPGRRQVRPDKPVELGPQFFGLKEVAGLSLGHGDEGLVIALRCLDAGDGAQVIGKLGLGLGIRSRMDAAAQIQGLLVADVPGVIVPDHPSFAQRHGGAERHRELPIDDAQGRVLGLFRVADDLPSGFRQADFHRFHILGFDVVGGAQLDQRIHGGVAVAATGIGLDRRFHGLPHLAQSFERLFGVRVGGIGVEEPGLALEGVGSATKPFVRQRRRHQAAHGRVADMETLGPGAIEKELHGTGGLAQGNAEGERHGVGVEAEHLARRRRGAEDAAGGRRVEAPVVMVGRPQCHAEAGLDLVSGDDGGDKLLAVDAGHLGRRQRRRHDGGAGMQRRARVGVVEIERMDQRAVDQRRALGGKAAAFADGDASAAAEAEAHGGLD